MRRFGGGTQVWRWRWDAGVEVEVGRRQGQSYIPFKRGNIPAN
ncbi:hypothetical protein AALC75_10070 [Lachnospiraceae bacterium 48-42]